MKNMFKYKKNELVNGHNPIELFKYLQKKYNKKNKYKYLKIPFVVNTDFSNPVFLFMARYNDMYTMSDMELLYECCVSMSSWTTSNFTKLLAVYFTHVNVLHTDIVQEYYSEINSIDRLKYKINTLSEEIKNKQDTLDYYKDLYNRQARKLGKYYDLYKEIEIEIENNKHKGIYTQDKVAIWSIILIHQEKKDHDHLNLLITVNDENLEKVYNTIKAGYYRYKKNKIG